VPVAVGATRQTDNALGHHDAQGPHHLARNPKRMMKDPVTATPGAEASKAAAVASEGEPNHGPDQLARAFLDASDTQDGLARRSMGELPVPRAGPGPGRPFRRPPRPQGPVPSAGRETSCYRYWDEGVWTDYGAELSRRTVDIVTARGPRVDRW
jgi:hypothetical protein